MESPPACPAGAATGDVVVCGRHDQPYRLRPLPERYEKPALPRAEARVGAAKLSAEGEQATIGGVPVNRAMVRLTFPF